ncbi:MAG: Nicotinate dehydrogenase FAD-subunit [Syntrophorhabdus sp. PtaU1.Bin153]|nr:MAG: Nicotinate dehydrogenase FAD-subunit [Syntrophorhabdus sp. PtaU1.Bin153]
MNVLLPSTAEDLWRILGDNPDALLCAGGTDLLVKVRAGMIRPVSLVCLERLDDFRGIRDEGDTFSIGACTPHTEIVTSSAIDAFLQVLKKAVHVLGSPPIRNMATLGGNICTASPAGDTLPALYALDAELELWSRSHVRRLPIDQFITGPGKTTLRKGEVLAAVRVRKPAGKFIHHFEKVGQRQAMSISIANLAALVKVDQTDTIENISLAWGSVGPTIVRSREVETALKGTKLSVEGLKQVFPLIDRALSPISDVRASSTYRRRVSANLLLRLAVHEGCRT